MAAYEIPGMRFSLEATGAIPRRRFISIDADEKAVLADGTNPIVGASAVDTQKEGEVLEIYDGIVIVEASETIKSGDLVKSNADGKVAKATAETAEGIAMTGANNGGFVSVKIG